MQKRRCSDMKLFAGRDFDVRPSGALCPMQQHLSLALLARSVFKTQLVYWISLYERPNCLYSFCESEKRRRMRESDEGNSRRNIDCRGEFHNSFNRRTFADEIYYKTFFFCVQLPANLTRIFFLLYRSVYQNIGGRNFIFSLMCVFII